MKEEWRDIVGYEGLYQVSNLGRVKSFRRVKPFILGIRLRCGYNRVALYKDGGVKNITVHRLVAQAFINNKYNKPLINHKNGVKIDNRVKNLEWCTHKENTIHSFENGLQERKVSNQDAIYIRENKGGLYQWQLAERFNVCQQMISMIQSGKRR